MLNSKQHFFHLFCQRGTTVLIVLVLVMCWFPLLHYKNGATTVDVWCVNEVIVLGSEFASAFSVSLGVITEDEWEEKEVRLYFSVHAETISSSLKPRWSQSSELLKIFGFQQCRSQMRHQLKERQIEIISQCLNIIPGCNRSINKANRHLWATCVLENKPL